ncbi:MAG TPA: RNA-guided pseudouridylation complex pseudouridine synthase subunit Cbf5 [Candidatus Krumholzibacteriaceae bacterium]|nr:RNA-guided pseudouridylation complex pseudouridine synthase subunit Cbf5 [Candidatus Krumholzibacteriaceae bacterium]
MPRMTAPWERERKLIVKAEEDTDPRYGHKPEERPIKDYVRFGVINLDKPSGPSSHEVTAWVKRILSVGHAGHGGTLDPKVTGVLPVALEDATKVIQALLLSGKEYVCVMRLHSDATEDRVKAVLEEFQGEIYQRPPLRASVKHRLRTRKIYYLDFLEMEGKNVLFWVGCEGGTYIRKLCYDLGEALGTGAHMQELRRTRAGPFIENDGLTNLYDVSYFNDQWKEKGDENALHKFIFPMERALTLLPRVFVRDSAVDALCHGANLAAPGVLSLEADAKRGDVVAVFTQKGEAVMYAKALASTEEVLSMEHGLVAQTMRVLMERGTYPKMWRSE